MILCVIATVFVLKLVRSASRNTGETRRLLPPVKAFFLPISFVRRLYLGSQFWRFVRFFLLFSNLPNLPIFRNSQSPNFPICRLSRCSPGEHAQVLPHMMIFPNLRSLSIFRCFEFYSPPEPPESSNPAISRVS